VQRGQVLLERGVLDGLLHGRREGADHLRAAAARLGRPLQFGDRRGERLGASSAVCASLKFTTTD
jgi:hypothetical protein